MKCNFVEKIKSLWYCTYGKSKDCIMGNNVLEIAKYIISYCTQRSMPISNLKLQKMLYFLWIDYYKTTNRMLFTENICAWQFGPVVPEVYYEFCPYGGMPINKQYDIVLNGIELDTIKNSIDKYLKYSVRNLVDLTHQIGKPWDSVYKNGVGARSIIPFSLIIDLECM